MHIEPDEVDTLAHIPHELLFPAPRLSRGHVVLGYDERGHCPMLIDDTCSIYEHRPRACRTYDCRVFAATGLAVDDEKPLIGERVARWKFSYPTPADRACHEAIRAEARKLGDETDGVPAASLAVRAIESVLRPPDD